MEEGVKELIPKLMFSKKEDVNLFEKKVAVYQRLKVS
jgi:hypothetical protein